ncbi:hypothetical protein SNEBB_009207 [Seison nebaliae]|nr:hypothetical protein SNEBB_009207 [Seison nebaliae]
MSGDKSKIDFDSGACGKVMVKQLTYLKSLMLNEEKHLAILMNDRKEKMKICEEQRFHLNVEVFKLKERNRTLREDNDFISKTGKRTVCLQTKNTYTSKMNGYNYRIMLQQQKLDDIKKKLELLDDQVKMMDRQSSSKKDHLILYMSLLTKIDIKNRTTDYLKDLYKFVCDELTSDIRNLMRQCLVEKSNLTTATTIRDKSQFDFQSADKDGRQMVKQINRALSRHYYNLCNFSSQERLLLENSNMEIQLPVMAVSRIDVRTITVHPMTSSKCEIKPMSLLGRNRPKRESVIMILNSVAYIHRQKISLSKKVQGKREDLRYLDGKYLAFPTFFDQLQEAQFNKMSELQFVYGKAQNSFQFKKRLSMELSDIISFIRLMIHLILQRLKSWSESKNKLVLISTQLNTSQFFTYQKPQTITRSIIKNMGDIRKICAMLKK